MNLIDRIRSTLPLGAAIGLGMAVYFDTSVRIGMFPAMGLTAFTAAATALLMGWILGVRSESFATPQDEN